MADRHIEIIARFLSDFGLPLDLTGKKVLDIGVWTGGTCLALCALGAEGKKSRTGWNYFVPTDKALKLWMETVGFHDVTVSALDGNRRYLAKGTRHAHEEMASAGLARRDIR